MASYSFGNAIVSCVRVMSHCSRDLGGNVSENHWSIYLLLPHEQSIRMNMRATPGNPVGRLETSVRSNQLPDSALWYRDYFLAPGITVNNIYALVVATLHRHRFRFSGGGSSCRHWWYVLQNSTPQLMTCWDGLVILWYEISRKQVLSLKDVLQIYGRTCNSCIHGPKIQFPQIGCQESFIDQR